MTQDERWLERYTEMKAFIESNHRNPSRHNPEERFKYCNWLKHNKKLLNAGEMKEDRVSLFENLPEMVKYRRKNQLNNLVIAGQAGNLIFNTRNWFNIRVME